jgi:UDP-N-acetylmuramoyl-L-alanine---L-glutamate ligase
MRTLEQAKHVAIWGYGREGRAAYDFIRAAYPQLPVTILSNETLLGDISLGDRTRVVQGDNLVTESIRSGQFDLIIKSPGISLYREEVQRAKARGLRFSSVTNLWFEQNSAARKIVVTGTKGKSTTARLLHFMLKKSGLDVQLAGNVGIPALGQSAGRDYTILELSSYQIADLEYAPDIAVVTNLFQEHAPWHGSAEQYYRDKLHVLALSERTIAVCSYDNERLRNRIAKRPNTIWFNAQTGYCATQGHLYYNNIRVDCRCFPLKGEHNLSNLAAACTVADLLGISTFRHVVDVDDFKQLEHRLEEFRVGRGTLCVNDSISTVPEATIAALRTYQNAPKILLLGGADRGQDYRELFELLPRLRVQSVFLLPPIGDRVYSELADRSADVDLFRAAGLRCAVKEAFRRLQPEDMLLLSPGAPSFGEFTNFEERGNAFRKYCNEYAGA